MIDFLEKLLEEQYGTDLKNKIIQGYSKKRFTTFRVNTLLASIDEIKEILNIQKINYKTLEYNSNCFIIENKKDIVNLDIYLEGKIYLQSISSMLPVWFLEPNINETILDMCAAPGSKTTQIAAITENKASITACEVNKIRASRLEFNLNKQKASAFVINKSALNLDDFMLFDKILLDAPCSGSGTFENGIIPKSFSYELVKNSSELQKKLLNKALKMLKKGSTMIYSTCSILDIENENVINSILKNNKCIIEPINSNGIDNLELLPSKVEGALVVMPNEYYEGFFVCKIKKARD